MRHLRLIPASLLFAVPLFAQRAQPPAEPAAGLETPALQFAAGGHRLGFMRGGVILAARDHVVRVDPVGANAVEPEALGRTDEAGAPPVAYRGWWDGVSVTFEPRADALLNAAWRVEPARCAGALECIRLRYNRPVTLDEHGNLVLRYDTGTLVDAAPVAFQLVDGMRRPVRISYRLLGEREVGFRADGAIDPDAPLVFDCVISWNAFLGGASGGTDSARAVAVDAGGSIYLTGSSASAWGAPVRAYTGGGDAFVAKLDGGGALIWNTFLGGSGGDVGMAIAVDAGGAVRVGGYSNAAWGAPVRAYTGGNDAFAAGLSAAGALLWNSFAGSAGADTCDSAALDGSGNFYLTGQSAATWGTPVRAFTGGNDGFVAKFDGGGALSWNTFLGGGANDAGAGLAVDGAGSVLVTGFSSGTWGAPVRAYSAGSDAFAAKLTSGGALAWNTFLGSGSGFFGDNGSGIAVDGGGNVYVTGTSGASWGAPVRAFTGGIDAFAVKLTSGGALSWNTFLGGSGSDWGSEIAVDGGGNSYIAGYGVSWGAPLRAYSSADDAQVVKLSSTGGLLWNTFLGGAGTDYGYGIALGAGGTVHVAGHSTDAWGAPLRAFFQGTDASVATLAGNGALVWNTFVGYAVGTAGSLSLAVDGSGNSYVAGSSDASWGAPARAFSGGTDGFCAKFGPDGAPVWNTFLGGGGFDAATGLAADASGVYVSGYSDASWGVPVRAHAGGDDAFAVKLDGGGALLWSTFLGGAGNDAGNGIAVESGGIVHVAGAGDASWGAPVRPFTGASDAFVAEVDASGALTWHTFLGGAGEDRALAIAVDGAGNAFVGGAGDATWGAPLRAHGPGFDGFAARLDGAGVLVWHTFLGGAGGDDIRGIAVDGAGNVLLAGGSDAAWGAPLRPYGTGLDGFVAKLDTGGALLWSTFLGDSGDELAVAVTADGAGNIYAAGSSSAAWGAPVRAYTSDEDAFAAKLTAAGTLRWHAFLGGLGRDRGLAIAVDGSGNVFAAGASDQAWGAPTRGYAGWVDGWVASIAPRLDLAAHSLNDPRTGGTQSAGTAFSPRATFRNAGSAPLTGAAVRYRISGPLPASADVYDRSVSLASLTCGASSMKSFPAIALGAGIYAIRAQAALVGDETPGNDEVSGTFEVVGPAIPGSVPDGTGGTLSFRLAKNAVNPATLDLAWGSSCGSGALDYAVYEGTIGAYYDHAPILCSTGGGVSLTGLAPGGASRYYLVVPLTATEEGFMGADSSGAPIPRGTTTCRALQDANQCF